MAADKKADAERKRIAREKAAPLVELPPLPSAGQAQPGQPPPAPGAAGPGPAPEAPPVPWQAELLREFTDEIIECLEDGRVESFRLKAVKGSVPPAVVKEILPDVRYPAPAKRTAKIAVPRVAAKWLNKSGVSAEYADEVALIGAVGMILGQGRKLNAKLDELIAAAKQNKPEEKKP